MTVRIAGGGTLRVPTTIRFDESPAWPAPPVLEALGAARPIDVSTVLFGDEVQGPVLFLVATPPGSSLPSSPAHGHASDSWRMSLLGSFPMGRIWYEPGDFRFQAGWRPYPSDNFAQGDTGGWTALLFGDRRGTRVRHAGTDPVPDVTAPLEAALAEWAGIGGDQVDPEDSCPESTMRTSLGASAPSGRVDGSFRDTARWDDGGTGVRQVTGLLGAEVDGPVVVCTDAAPGALLAPACEAPVDVIRVIVRGTCRIDGIEHSSGHVYVQPSGSAPAVVAGPDGASEVVLIADRRTVAETGGWLGVGGDVLLSSVR